MSKLDGNTDEDGGQASFTVELTSEPTATVSISIYSSDTGEGTVSPANLSFGAGNWSNSQTITITGVSDDIVDGNQTYTIVIEPASSADTDYNSIDLPDIQVTNINTNVLFPPTELEAKAGIGSIRLYWNDSISPYLAGYYVYRSESETGSYVQITTEVVKGNSYTDKSDFTFGITYWYYLTAVDMLGNKSTESNKASAEAERLKLFIPDSSGGSNTQVRLPVNIDNADGLDLCAADIALTYDTNVLYIPTKEEEEPGAPLRAEKTALTAMHGWATNLEEPGVVRIAASCGGDSELLYGEGSLFYILFDVVGSEGDWTDMEFDDREAMTALYSQDDLFNPLPLDLEDIGRFTVICGFMLGDLTGNCILTEDDVQMAREISCGNIKLTDENKEELLRAGDLSGDGRIRANDACLIDRLMNGLELAPSVQDERKRRSSPRSDLANVSVPADTPIAAGSSVWVPVRIDDAAELKNGDIVLNYDSSFITATGARAGSAMEDFGMTFNREQAGQVIITFNATADGSNWPQGLTTLAEVRFTAKSDIPDDISIPIILASVRLSDDYGRDFETSVRQMEVSMTDGSLVAGDGSVVSPELINAIKALQVAAGMNPDGADAIADVNGDQRIGLEEAIYLIQVAADMRDGSETRM